MGKKNTEISTTDAKSFDTSMLIGGRAPEVPNISEEDLEKNGWKILDDGTIVRGE